jgi:hypothetical protein
MKRIVVTAENGYAVTANISALGTVTLYAGDHARRLRLPRHNYLGSLSYGIARASDYAGLGGYVISGDEYAKIKAAL